MVTFLNDSDPFELAMLAYLFPGQGSQQMGMGGTLFDEFPLFTAKADEILGYSIKQLCLENPDRKLLQTEFTQPALYVVDTLQYLKTLLESRPPDFVAGHSLGEYAALFASGVFDFETGLRLVRTRAQLMKAAPAGAMMAVMGIPMAQVEAILERSDTGDVSIANDNAPEQAVLAGSRTSLDQLITPLESAGASCMVLNVSGAFHSRFVSQAASEFSSHLEAARFSKPRIPVIANVTGEPYPADRLREILSRQIESQVQWRRTMFFMLDQGVDEIVEVGPGRVLTSLFAFNRKGYKPSASARVPVRPIAKTEPEPPARVYSAETLGSESFRQDHGVRMAYVAGAMYKGIASKELVVRMGEAGLLGFFGSGGLRLTELEDSIQFVRRQLSKGQAHGFNLLHQPDDPRLENETVSLFLRHDIRSVEAAAYLEMTEPLLHFRYKGAYRNGGGLATSIRRVIAKVSRPEVARLFMSPGSEAMLRNLVGAGHLTREEANLAREIPISDDVCVEADSGGHTDAGVAYALMPAMKRLRDEMMKTHAFRRRIRLGAAGGLGSPEAIAAALVLGADFILTGSVNQCTPEAGTSDAVKDMLQRLDVQDTTYAPAGDMFELGARVQVMKRGVLFPARANKLFEIYRRYESIEAIEPPVRATLERTCFKRGLDEIWHDVRDYYEKRRPEELEKAARNPKHKMAMVFKWYFAHTTRIAMAGEASQSADFQVHCGPAMGAFNRFVKGTELEDWRRRHVEIIATKLMEGAAGILNRALAHAGEDEPVSNGVLALSAVGS